jgi:hypothetical protein
MSDKIKKNDMGGACGTHGARRGAYSVLFGILREGNHFEDLLVDGRIILNLTIKKWNRAETELIWLRTGTDGGLL